MTLPSEITTAESPQVLQHRVVRGPELRRSLRMVTLAWVFGAIWITATAGAPVTLFAKGLGASEFQFGLLAAIPFMAALISVPASILIERTGQRKFIFLLGLYTQRCMWLVIGIIPLWVYRTGGSSAGPAAMVVFLFLMFVMYAGNALGGPAWVSWMGDIVPARSRGKYFAKRRQLGMLVSIPTAIAVGYMLDRLNVPGTSSPADPARVMNWCAGIFVAAGFVGFWDVYCHQWVPHSMPRRHEQSSLLSGLKRALADRQFMYFSGFIATLTFAVSFMGQFATLYLIKKLNVTSMEVQLMLLVGPMLVQIPFLPIWGRACDRMGKKPVLIIAGLALVPIGLGWCFMHSGGIWLGFVLAAAGAVAWTGVEVANLDLVLEMSASRRNGEPAGGSSFVAINSLVGSIAGCLGGLSSGIIAEWLRNMNWETGTWLLGSITFYQVLFAMSAIMRLFAVMIFLPHIHEHDAKPTREALRFMTANLYNNVYATLMQPLLSSKDNEKK